MRVHLNAIDKLPADAAEQQHTFLCDFRSSVNEDYEYCSIGTMDETAVAWERGKITVVLSCFADGGKGMPFVVVNSKRAADTLLPPGSIFPSGVLVESASQGAMTETVMLAWLAKCWSRSVSEAPAVLVMDKYYAHTTDKVR
eukprot:GHVU01067982.1.p1 GENE.GHVU01067982.1~~GHVU01067982.1.p1  ORF type:complete len:142 (-),score=18.43 GHVU01067982.1:1382-1807(-)